jgi:transposase
MRKSLTENVRYKIAFEIFSTTKSHEIIAGDFNVSRSTVSTIAREFKLQRRPLGGHGNRSSIKSPARKHDIETVNWTYDDSLILARIERRKEAIRLEVNRLVDAAINF